MRRDQRISELVVFNAFFFIFAWLWEKTEIHTSKSDLESVRPASPPPWSKCSGEEGKCTCIKPDRGRQIHGNPMRNPISMEYIKFGSVVYRRANCSAIDVSLFDVGRGETLASSLDSV